MLLRNEVAAQFSPRLNRVGVDRNAPAALLAITVEFLGRLHSEPLSTNLVLVAPFRLIRPKKPLNETALSVRQSPPKPGAILLFPYPQLTTNRRKSLKRTTTTPPFPVRLQHLTPGEVQPPPKNPKIGPTLPSPVPVPIVSPRAAPMLLQTAQVRSFKHPMTQPPLKACANSRG